AASRRAPLMLLARFVHLRALRHLGHRDFPPALVVRHALVAVGGYMDDYGFIDGLRGDKGIAQLVDASRTDHMSAEPLGVQCQVDRQRSALVRTGVVPEGAVFSMAIPGPETRRALRP